jgi:hypothetical protein
MVFAVNAPTTGRTFDAFQNGAKGGAASGAGSDSSSGSGPGSGTSTSGTTAIFSTGIEGTTTIVFIPVAASSESSLSPPPTSTSASDTSGGRESQALGEIIGSICGLLFLILIFSLVYCKYYRRRRSLNYTLTDREGHSTQMRQVDKQELSPTHIDPFTLKRASNGVSSSQAKQTFISDRKIPPEIPPGDATQVSGNTESKQTPDSRNLFSDSDSEDLSRRPSSSAANSLAPSITTVRRQRLQEQEQASASQLASLEARIGSAEWVSRAEYDVMATEMGRLRAELSWLRDAQQSEWALGLSDEMPPPYSHATVEPR